MNDSLEEENEQVLTLLWELLEASSRSVYEEIQCFTATQNSMAEIKLGAKRFKSFSISQNIQSRTWSMIIQDICEFVPIMTESEYLIASYLVSICLLSYILPQKKKPDKVRSNNAPEQRTLNNLAEELVTLECILESAAHDDGFVMTSTHPFIIQNELIQASMWDFIYKGLGTFLACRKLCILEMTISLDNGKCIIISGSSDLLHVLSMSICNDYSMNKNDDDLSNRVLHIMNQSNRRSFQTSNLMRGEIVHVISRTLSLPSIDNTEKSATESLITGGVLHLRIALQNFSMMALDPYHLIDARRAIASIAVDTELFIEAVIKSLLSDMMINHSSQSPTPNCRSISKDTVKHRLNSNLNDRYVTFHIMQLNSNCVLESQMKRQTMKKDFCIGCSTGDVLLDMIARCSRSRYHANELSTQNILADVANMITDLCNEIKNDDLNQTTNNMMSKPCSIAALLDCARLLLYFSVDQNVSDPDIKKHERQGIDTRSIASLIKCGVEFLNFSEYSITKSASSFLALAFTYENPSSYESLVRKIFVYLKNRLHQMDDNEIVCDLVGVLSRSNHQFACSIIKFSFDEILSSKSNPSFMLKIVNIVSSARPMALNQYLNMNSIPIDLSTKISTKYLTYMYLSLKRSLSFDQDANEWTDKVSQLLVSVSDLWSLFQVARYAICTGNFNIAQNIIEERLLSSSSTASSYSWLSILSSVAGAEHLLQSNGSNEIVQALCRFNQSLILLRSLESTANISARLQIDIVSCRRDFLNLCLVVLNLSGEARLSHKAIRMNRRTCLHIRNLPRCFHVVASRYYEIYKRNGLFCCENTRSYLRTQFRLCTFFAGTVQRAFASKPKDSKNTVDEDLIRGWPKGDKSSLLMELTSTIENKVLNYWDNNQVDPEERAAQMSDIVDSIMKSVNPLPKGFFSFKDIPVTTMHVTMKQGPSMSYEDRVVPYERMTYEVDVAKSFSLTFNGTIPPRLFKLSDQPFSQVMVLCQFSLDGPLQRDEDECDLDKVFPTHSLESITTESTLLPGAKFQMECACPYFSREGYFRCDVKLQVRDIRCGEYTIPSSLDDESIILVCKSSSV
jgi:hypothetical protein